MIYDSTTDTIEHIKNVKRFTAAMAKDLIERGSNHDASKLQSPEKEMFDRYTPLLRETTYGSDKYKEYLAEMGTALAHHYKNNAHHPEHFENGVDGMTLLDLLEMFCDWQAAVLRHADGNMEKSIAINAGRFKMSDQLRTIFTNTLKYIGRGNA